MATEEGRLIGARIRRAREQRRWSQADMAAATGVDVKTVRNWEKTGRIRNRGGLIEHVLGIRLDGSDEPRPQPDDGTDASSVDLLAARTAELAELARRMQERQREQQERRAAGPEERRTGTS